jgi:cobalt/nickel transport system permease protein
MAHIHLEDGTFTILWVIIWWAVAIVLIGMCLLWLRKNRKIDNRTITMASLCTAAAFAIFQVEIPIPLPLFGGIHLNFTPLIGILAGPAMGGIRVLIDNVFRAAVGPGGWGRGGANCIVNLSEVFVTYVVYRALGRFNLDAFSLAGMGTIFGLFTGNLAMMGIILASGIQGIAISRIDLLNSLVIIAAVNMLVAIVEAFVTGYIVSYFEKGRPDMLGEPLAVRARPRVNGMLLLVALIVVVLAASVAIFVFPNLFLAGIKK